MPYFNLIRTASDEGAYGGGIQTVHVVEDHGLFDASRAESRVEEAVEQGGPPQDVQDAGGEAAVVGVAHIIDVAVLVHDGERAAEEAVPAIEYRQVVDEGPLSPLVWLRDLDVPDGDEAPAAELSIVANHRMFDDPPRGGE